MICERCQKREATVHFEQTVNQQHRAYHLCQTCAEAEGLVGFGQPFSGQLFEDWLSDVPLIWWPSTQQERPKTTEPLRCPTCGRTWADFRKCGRFGCSDCYETFRPYIKEVIGSVQSGYQHVGKSAQGHASAVDAPAVVDKPDVGSEVDDLKAEIAALEAAKKRAIAAEDYDQAAQLRDQIRQKRLKEDI